jgi:hypothetical protein
MDLTGSVSTVVPDDALVATALCAKAILVVHPRTSATITPWVSQGR